MKGWRPHWNLWHLLVLVFVTALILGAIRFFESNRMALETAALFVGCLIAMVPGLMAIHQGVKLANETTQTWKEQGRLRGGQDGLLQILFARLVRAIIILASLFVGTIFFRHDGLDRRLFVGSARMRLANGLDPVRVVSPIS